MRTYKRIRGLNNDWADDEIAVWIAADKTAKYRHKMHNAWTASKPVLDALQNAERDLQRRHPKATRVVVLLDDGVEWDANWGELVDQKGLDLP